MAALCRTLFALAVRIVTVFWLGYSLRGAEHLPRRGPAIVIANHNSHLDALILFSLFPIGLAPSISIAAAADYFFSGSVRRFLAERFAGLVPIARHGGRDPLGPAAAALQRGNVLILFPEGTRGAPDVMGDIKPGLRHLARRFPRVPICPVYLHGPGRSLPKGCRIPVPIFIDICAGAPFFPTTDREAFPRQIRSLFENLRAQTLAGLADPQDDDDGYA